MGELTENVLHFKNSTDEDYRKFFKWVTDSIKTSSISVENNSSGFELAKLDGETISKIDLTKSAPNSLYLDNNYVVLAGKCQNTKRPYLMKYRKHTQPSGFGDFQTRMYRLVGGFQVDNTYYELSDDTNTSFSVSSDELMGAPTCPCCGNQFGFAMCTCSKIHCIGDEETSTCPWCNNQGNYTSGEGGFDVNRTLG